jgi:hypothetical protein
MQYLLPGEPVFLAGSLAAHHITGKGDFGDVDLFTPTHEVLISTVKSLLMQGATLDDRFDRVWHRWLRYGLKGWHTQSIRLHTLKDTPVNVVFKLVDGHPTTSLAQVLESFDFGLLAVGLDLESNQWRDMRPFLFPGMDVDGPLPLMPNKREAWINGFVSKYNGLREAGRYGKYWQYGYDLSLVKADLVQGYRLAGLYHSSQFDEDKQLLGQIYNTIADRMEDDEVDELVESYKSLDFNDSLDEILAALE